MLFRSFYFGSLGFGSIGFGNQGLSTTYFGYGSPWLGNSWYSTYSGWPSPYGWSGTYAPGYYASDSFGTTYFGTNIGGAGLFNAGVSGWGLDPLAGTTVVDSRPVIIVAPGAKNPKPTEEAKPAEPPLVIRSRTRESPPAARKPIGRAHV